MTDKCATLQNITMKRIMAGLGSVLLTTAVLAAVAADACRRNRETTPLPHGMVAGINL